MIHWALIIRTTLTSTLLVTAYRETGWATALLIGLILLRFEIEALLLNKLLDKANKRLDEMKLN
jgi:hypothetical protein